MALTDGNLPRHAVPPIGPDGRWTHEWWMFLQALFYRTGGPGSPIDILTLQKQDEISQDVPPQNAATMSALRGVEELWSEQRAPDNQSAILSRLNDLESALQTYPDLGPIAQRLADLEAWLADMKSPASIVQEQWNAPTLLNGWANYGVGRNPAGYWKDSLGVVHLRGVIASGTVGSTAFTLPASYRPQNQELLATTSTTTVGSYVNVSTNGNVDMINGTNTWWSLDGLTFRAYQ